MEILIIHGLLIILSVIWFIRVIRLGKKYPHK